MYEPYDEDRIFETAQRDGERFCQCSVHQLWIHITKNKKLFPWNKMIFDFLRNRINHFMRTCHHSSNTFMRHGEFSRIESLDITRRFRTLGDKMTNFKNISKTWSI